MRLVMGGESLLGPLTGIGHYTYHLAKHLLAREEVEELKFLVHGFLKDSALLLEGCEQFTVEARYDQAIKFRNMISSVRSIAARNSTAVNLHDKVCRLLEKSSLKNYSPKAVYHSPNYMLPEFPGKKVVSILDLSTYRYPQFHPEARVRFVNDHIRRSIEKADHIITISSFIKEEIIERFRYPSNKVSITYLGADDSFRPISAETFYKTPLSIKLPYKKYFLLSSTIEPRKNIEKLLDAYLLYRSSNIGSTLPLVITGIPGWKCNRILNRIKKLEDQGCVHYLGYVNRNILPILVAGATAMLYPSLYEGFGLPVLEAMQSGTAVMTTKGSSMAEIGGQSLLQIDAYVIEDMAEAINLLANDTMTERKLVAAGLKAAKKYSWERCANQTLGVYQKVLM